MIPSRVVGDVQRFVHPPAAAMHGLAVPERAVIVRIGRQAATTVVRDRERHRRHHYAVRE